MRRLKNTVADAINSGSTADIAFLLLIFFMVATSMQREKSISMKLPPAYNGPPGLVSDNKVLSIGINAENEIIIEGKQQGLHMVLEQISFELSQIWSSHKSPIISLKIHPECNYEIYMTILSYVKHSILLSKESKAKELYQKDLNQLNSEQYAALNELMPIRITESEYEI